MYCVICNHDFPADCTCDDRDERIMQLRTTATHIGLQICVVCDKHVDLCDCLHGPKAEWRTAKPEKKKEVANGD